MKEMKIHSCPLCKERVKLVTLNSYYGSEYYITCTNCELSFGLIVQITNGCKYVYGQSDKRYLIQDYNKFCQK